MAAASLLVACGTASTALATDYTFGDFSNGNLTLTTGDTLSIGSGSGNFTWISYGTESMTARTVDASLATSVTMNVGELRVGGRSNPTSTSTSSIDGRLFLGGSNTITASALVNIGGGGHIFTGIMTAPASSTTLIQTPAMNVGVAMRTSTPIPSVTIGSGASLTLEGLGGGRTALVVGQEANASSGINWSSVGNMDLSAGSASLKLSSLVIGNTPLTGTETGSATGTVTMSTSSLNHLDVSGSGNVIRIGTSAKTDTNANNSTNGTLTIGHLGSNSSITSTDNNTAILIGHTTGTTVRPVTGTLALNGGTVTITTTGAAIAGSNMTSNVTLSGGVTLRAGAASSNWIHSVTNATIGSGGANFDTNGHDLGMAQVFTGVGGLTKAGDGTLILSGSQSYTGATNVSGGTLEIGPTGLINSSSGVTISSGGSLAYNGSTALSTGVTFTSGTLGGTNWSGSLSGLTIGANQTISPGNSPGTANTGSQAWDTSGTYVWEINDADNTAGSDPGWDLLAGTGTLDITATSGSPFTIRVTSLDEFNDRNPVFNFDGSQNYEWLIADFASITGFEISKFAINTSDFDNAFSGTFGIALGGTGPVPGDNSQIYLTYVAVPEPGTLALLAAAGLAAAFRRRR